MPKICYETKNFSVEKMRLVNLANSILNEYASQGFHDLTLRQLYYQMVARAVIPNVDKEYAKLGDLISDARMAGLIDWNSIVDRTRNVVRNSHWEKPSDIVAGTVDAYAIDKWADQPQYVEVWIEKDALKGVIAGICSRLDVPYFSCRGYTSQSEMWGAAQRLIKRIDQGKEVHIIHLGDHDPSGIDMSRDIRARLLTFLQGRSLHVLRVALNMPQIQRYNPPPNPAKVTDSRYAEYMKNHGTQSWELDALEPMVLVDVIERAVKMFRDEAKWKSAVDNQERGRKTLKAITTNFFDVVKYLRTRNGDKE